MWYGKAGYTEGFIAMAQTASPSPDPSSHHAAVYQPYIIRGAEDQTAAYDTWLARWAQDDAEDEERAWQTVELNLQPTRRDLDQRLIFPE